jgi:DNA-binding CsgD family transcriptional regulator
VTWAEWSEFYRPTDKLYAATLARPGQAIRSRDLCHCAPCDHEPESEAFHAQGLSDDIRCVVPATPGEVIALGLGRRKERPGRFVERDRLVVSAVAKALAVGWRRERAVLSLTPREFDVARLVSDARSLKEVAVELGIGIETARTHLRAVYKKTGATTRVELARLIA